MKVKECMCSEVFWVLPDATICECAKIMEEKHIGCLPICNLNNEIVGIVTDRDLILRAIANNKDINNTKVSDIMTLQVCCCEATAGLEEAQRLMEENKIRRIPVLENNKIVGILTLGDLAKNKDTNTKGIGKVLENICKNNDKNAE